MIKLDSKSNAQAWELEVICKNKKYLDAVVTAILKYGMIDFEVENEEFYASSDGSVDGRYIVLIWCSWFHNLASLSNDLEKIEQELD